MGFQEAVGVQTLPLEGLHEEGRVSGSRAGREGHAQVSRRPGNRDTTWLNRDHLRQTL